MDPDDGWMSILKTRHNGQPGMNRRFRVQHPETRHTAAMGFNGKSETKNQARITPNAPYIFTLETFENAP